MVAVLGVLVLSGLSLLLFRAWRAALAQARERRRALGRERGAALDRRRAQLVEARRLALGRLVSVDGSVRTRQAALAIEVARDAPGELLDQLGDIGVGERRGGLETRREARAARNPRWRVGPAVSNAPAPPPQRAPNSSPARHQGPIWALVDHLTDRSAAASLPIAVDADRLRRKSSAWSSYPPTLFKEVI